jgi:hypothetical protein
MEIIVKRFRVSLPVAAAASVLLALSAPAAAAVSVASGVTPAIERGPKATPTEAQARPGYGLFTCQLPGYTGPGQCYDPYQMRHAYGIDSLIADGFTGKGRTIVIVDAFQSPNIVQNLNFYDAFYALPGLNGLGNPNDPSLGTFTQVAPDGLTPFVPDNANMTGWAEEITLDVLWAHAIAPGANIALVLSKTNDDADILSATRYAVDHNLGDVLSQSFGENENCVDPTIMSKTHDVFADGLRLDGNGRGVGAAGLGRRGLGTPGSGRENTNRDSDAENTIESEYGHGHLTRQQSRHEEYSVREAA